MNLTHTLQPLDFAIIGAYLLVLVGVNWLNRSHTPETDDLFLAGRSLTWPRIGLSIFGTDINPSSLIAGASIGYTTGIVAGNFDWLAWIFLLLLGMVFVPHYLSTHISTMPEFLKRRFGAASYTFLSWFNLVTIIVIFLGGTFFAGGVLLEQLIGWPLWASVLVLAALATSFTALGGLAAVVRTEAFQSVFIILSSATLTLIAFSEKSALSRGVVSGVPARFWHVFRPADDAVYPWPRRVCWATPLWAFGTGVPTRPLCSGCWRPKNVREGQLGTLLAASLKILMPIIFCLAGHPLRRAVSQPAQFRRGLPHDGDAVAARRAGRYDCGYAAGRVGGGVGIGPELVQHRVYARYLRHQNPPQRHPLRVAACGPLDDRGCRRAGHWRGVFDGKPGQKTSSTRFRAR